MHLEFRECENSPQLVMLPNGKNHHIASFLLKELLQIDWIGNIAVGKTMDIL